MLKTNPKLRNLIFYQVFVRNHTIEGTLNAIIPDLDRIKSLGVDYVYLLPIHPIGKKQRKGQAGSPYSILDYREVSEDIGTMNDFKEFIHQVHQRKMKVMMDVVFNHTSRDSRLLKEHPEWFYKNVNGEFANRIGEWSDVTDFDYTKDKALWVELADTLKCYTLLGVDGFRADVASLIPIEFWKFARKVVSKVNSKVIWLSESVHGGFLKYIRDIGYNAYSESEIFQAFDMTYDYDVHPYFEAYLNKERPLKEYLEAISRQEEIYPKNYVKLKNLENHDLARVAFVLQNNYDKIYNWTAFLFFQKGAVMLYAGQEFLSDRKPDLFEKDVVVRNQDISPFIKKLTKLKGKSVFSTGIFTVNLPKIDGVAYNTFENISEKMIGIFNVGQHDGLLKVDLKDGKYNNYLSKKKVTILDGHLHLTKEPIIIQLKK